MNGAQHVAEALRRLGAEVVFSVSGIQILSLFDALPEAKVKIVHARHENAAVYMAEAWGQLRGQPGIALLTAGPGVTSAVTAVANAQASESPVLVLSGASPISQRGLGAFQEMDQVTLLGPFCKAAWSVETPQECGPAVEKAWRLATTAVPAPVYLSFPVDVLESGGIAEPEAPYVPGPPTCAKIQRACREDLQRVVDILARARQPVVLARPSLRRAGTSLLLDRLERRVATLVAESPRGLRDPLWGERGHYLKEADAVLLLGPQDFAVGFGPPGGRDRIVLQVSSDPGKPDDAGSGSQISCKPHLIITADETQFLADILPLLESALPMRSSAPPVTVPSCPVDSGPLHPLAIAEEVRRVLGPDDLLIVDGGEFGQWMRAGFRDLTTRQLVNGKLGAIGNSIPQAIGAVLASQGRRIFAFLGDGTFSYHAAELDTAVRERLSLIVIIGNDSCYGAEWHIQAARYGPARTRATVLERREYERVAEGYGAMGMAAESRAELRSVLGTAVRIPPPAVICVNVHIRSVPSIAAGA